MVALKEVGVLYSHPQTLQVAWKCLDWHHDYIQIDCIKYWNYIYLIKIWYSSPHGKVGWKKQMFLAFSSLNVWRNFWKMFRIQVNSKRKPKTILIKFTVDRTRQIMPHKICLCIAFLPHMAAFKIINLNTVKLPRVLQRVVCCLFLFVFVFFKKPLHRD